MKHSDACSLCMKNRVRKSFVKDLNCFADQSFWPLFYFFFKKERYLLSSNYVCIIRIIKFLNFFLGYFEERGFMRTYWKVLDVAPLVFLVATLQNVLVIYIYMLIWHETGILFHRSCVASLPSNIYLSLHYIYRRLSLNSRRIKKKKMKNTHDKNSVNNSIIIRHMLPVPCIGTPYCHTMQKPLISKKAQFPVWISDAIIE